MKKRTFTKEFKEEAVRLVLSERLGIREAAADLGISQSGLRKWVDASRTKGAGAFPGSGNLNPEEQKIRDLEKKLRLAEMERDILKKATAFFAKDSL
jgi:transposase